MRRRSYDAAAALLTRAVAVEPTNPYGRSSLARVHLDSNRFAEAEAEAAAAVGYDPISYRAHYYLGWARTAQHRPAEAIGPLQNAIRLAPARPRAHYTLALCYMALSQTDQAIAELTVVLRAQPDYRLANALLRRMKGRPGVSATQPTATGGTP